MHIESIKILRARISIPLNKAIELLGKYNGDVALSEQHFHDENILEICNEADCDEETARKEYQICNYDITKAIERINQKLVIIGTGRTNSKIGFILWPENEKGESYKTAKRNDAFIAGEDFDLVKNEFQSVFPLTNPWNGVVENELDHIGHNFFDNKKCHDIVEKISQIETNDIKEQIFYNQIIQWLNDKLTYADFIVIYGNL